MEGGADLLLLGPLDPMMLVEAAAAALPTAEVVTPRRLTNMVQRSSGVRS